MKRAYIITAAIFIALLLGVLAVMVIRGPMRESFASCEGGSVAGADIGGPFTLVDETGQTVTESDVITGPTLVYFGFTNCPDVCPIDSARNGLVTSLLEDRGIQVTPVLITVDPGRDTPEAMAEYTDNFHDRMLGLTGSKEQIAAVTKAYRVYASVTEAADSGATPEAETEAETHSDMAMDQGDSAPMAMDADENTTDHTGHGEIQVNHSAYTYLMMPGTGLADFFGREIGVNEMADRVSCAVRAR